jgi:hypothetical protein
MLPNGVIVRLEDGDDIYPKLLTLGNSLRPHDDAKYFFFEIVRELVDASLTNYRELRRGYIESNYPLVAWACRNLLELAILTQYVLKSEENARRFADDRLIDGCELIVALRELERHLDPTSPTPWLDDALTRMQVQRDAEGVTATGHLMIIEVAKEVGDAQVFRSMNKVSSKLVHPTAWSVLATNNSVNSYRESKELLYSVGVGEMSRLYLFVQAHNEKHGMLPLANRK